MLRTLEAGRKYEVLDTELYYEYIEGILPFIKKEDLHVVQIDSVRQNGNGIVGYLSGIPVIRLPEHAHLFELIEESVPETTEWDGVRVIKVGDIVSTKEMSTIPLTILQVNKLKGCDDKETQYLVEDKRYGQLFLFKRNDLIKLQKDKRELFIKKIKEDIRINYKVDPNLIDMDSILSYCYDIIENHVGKGNV